jgi:hypothetical protein
MSRRGTPSPVSSRSTTGAASAAAVHVVHSREGRPEGEKGPPHDLQGEKIRSQFLYDGTRSLFEKLCFSYERSKGKKDCVMRTTVSPVEAS